MSASSQVPEVPSGPAGREPLGVFPHEVQRDVLLVAMAEAGVELGAYDRRIVEWLAGWEWSVVALVAAWVRRANAPAQVRAAALREAAPEVDAICEQYGVLGVGNLLLRMAEGGR